MVSTPVLTAEHELLSPPSVHLKKIEGWWEEDTEPSDPLLVSVNEPWHHAGRSALHPCQIPQYSKGRGDRLAIQLMATAFSVHQLCNLKGTKVPQVCPD